LIFIPSKNKSSRNIYFLSFKNFQYVGSMQQNKKKN
jgi:hypothetical protein